MSIAHRTKSTWRFPGIAGTILLLATAIPSRAVAGEMRNLIVMDPLAAPLSCPCVQGYAQRDYERLAEYLARRTGQPYQVLFSESLPVALARQNGGRTAVVIGKDSVVRSDAAALNLPLRAVARLSGLDGSTTQTGMVVVRGDDPATKVDDLRGYRILFGPAECEEKHAAVMELLEEAGIELPENIETSKACSDGACQIIEWGPDAKGAAVISSYAQPLLEGCGTIEKGDLRVVATTRPVPFITAFVNGAWEAADQEKLQAALLDVQHEPPLRQALESLLGFVPLAADEVGEEVAAKKK